MMMRYVLIAIFLLLGGLANEAAAQRRTATTRAEMCGQSEDGSIRGRLWNHSNSTHGERVSVSIKNEVRFNDAYTEITSVGPNSCLRIREEGGGVVRQLDAVPGEGGQPRLIYTVQGQERALDAEGRAWMVRMLERAVRDGLDAQPRAARILRERGANALLAAAAQLTGDHVRRIYYQELVENGNPNDETLRRLLRQAARDISGDYEMARLLLLIAPRDLSAQTRAAFFEAVDTVGSDYEKARVLRRMAERPFGDTAARNAFFAAARTISSDYEKARVLLRAIERHLDDEAARAAFFATVRTISSDYEKARVLVRTAQAHRQDAGLRAAVLDAVATMINSDYERQRVLRASR